MSTDDEDDVWLSAEAGTAPRPGELAPGDTVAGHVVEGEIGRGGMARVYRVAHPVLGTARALKVLQVAGPALRARVLREARTMAALDHPGIVRIIDVVEVGGLPALLLELVDGPPLDRWLATHRPTPDEALALFRGIVEAVAHAHRRGFVHRDLKPGNVLLATGPDVRPVPRVTDFGLAKLLDADQHGITRSGATMGTLVYMPPEQVRDSSRVDARADVFSLGCVLYELLCGRRAFTATDPIEMHRAATDRSWTPPGELVPDLPEGVDALVRALLAPDRDERPPDGAEVLRALDALAVPSTSVSAPALPAARPRPALAPLPARARRGLLALAALAPLVSYGESLLLPIDDLLAFPVIRLARGSVPMDDVVVIAIDHAVELHGMRERHAALIDRLVESEVRAIAFDISFRGDEPADAALADAIGRAERRGVPVVVATQVEGERARPLAAAFGGVRVGHVQFEDDPLFDVIGGVQARAGRTGDDWLWSLAIAVTAAAERAEVSFDNRTLRIGRIQVPCRGGQLVFPPTDEPTPLPYDAAAFPDAKDRIALVGQLRDDELRSTPDGERYGVEVHATAVQTLLRQAWLVRVGPEGAAALAWIAAAATAALRRRLPGGSGLLAGVPLLSALALAVALAAGGTLVSVVPTLLACGLALVAFSSAPTSSGT